MKQKMFNQIFRDYFTFNKTERQGFIILGVLMVIALLLNYLAGKVDPGDPAELRTFTIEPEEAGPGPDYVQAPSGRLFRFNPNTIERDAIDSLDLPGNIRSNLLRYRDRGGVFRTPGDIRRLYGMNDSIFMVIQPYLVFTERKELKITSASDEPKIAALFPFDPNTVDDSTLSAFGLSPYLVRNIVAYRKKGGKFDQKQDVQRIYGMDGPTYAMLEPFIQIESAPMQFPGPPEMVILDINQADSLEWLKLPGIGPVFASRILRYRQRLGGFHSTGQLAEVYGMTPERLTSIESLIKVLPGGVSPIRLNFAGYDELRSHPYITPGQAKEMIRIRSEYGPYGTLDILLKEGVFEPEALEKVKPYLVGNQNF
jgi:DNA uptake protein ComE-like DNA-binding protein